MRRPACSRAACHHFRPCVDSDLRAAFEATEYRVRLARGGWAAIRIGEALPAPLQAATGTRCWGFVTAWNPGARLGDWRHNRAAQRRLIESLRALPSTVAIRPALGVATDWREPSLFVIGPDTSALDALARHYQQRAYVHGQACGCACLRWLD